MHHKRKRGIKQRAACWCKAEKKLGHHELRGGNDGGRASRMRLTERAKESDG